MIKKSCEIEVIGVPVSGQEEDYLRTNSEDADNTYIGMSSFLEKAGAKRINNYIAHVADREIINLDNEELDKEENEIFYKRHILQYRSETGNKYPTVYRIKMTAEVEELSQEEAEKFWRGEQVRYLASEEE